MSTTLIGAWTAADMKHAAKYACYRVRLEVFENHVREDSLYECALSEVGMAVTLNPDIDFTSAIEAATDELRRMVQRTRQTHGVDERGNTRPRFAAYWLDFTDLVGRIDSTHACVEPIALRQVLAALSDDDLRVLWVMAFTDSLVEAAKVLGVGTSYMSRLAREARQRALTVMYDHETPPDVRRLSVTRRRNKEECVNGHPLTGDNVLMSRNVRGARTIRCATCRGRGETLEVAA